MLRNRICIKKPCTPIENWEASLHLSSIYYVTLWAPRFRHYSMPLPQAVSEVPLSSKGVCPAEKRAESLRKHEEKEVWLKSSLESGPSHFFLYYFWSGNLNFYSVRRDWNGILHNRLNGIVIFCYQVFNSTDLDTQRTGSLWSDIIHTLKPFPHQSRHFCCCWCTVVD